MTDGSWSAAIVLICERYGFTFEDIKKLTLLQFKLLLQGAEKTDENSRYSKMTDETKAVAEKLKSRFGGF